LITKYFVITYKVGEPYFGCSNGFVIDILSFFFFTEQVDTYQLEHWKKGPTCGIEFGINKHPISTISGRHLAPENVETEASSQHKHESVYLDVYIAKQDT